MDLNDRMDNLDEEVMVLKNQIHNVLLDIREHVLTSTANPFESDVVHSQHTVQMAPSPPPPQTDTSESEPAKQSRSDDEKEKKKEGGEDQDSTKGGKDKDTESSDEKSPAAELESLMENMRKEREALERGRQEMSGLASDGEAASPKQGGGYGSGPGPAADPMQGMGPGPRAGFERGAGDQGRERSDMAGTYGGFGQPEQGQARGPYKAHDVWKASKARAGSQDTPQSEELDLTILIRLMRWIEKGVKRIGKQKMEVLIDLYEASAYLPATYKESLLQMMTLTSDGAQDSEEEQDGEEEQEQQEEERTVPMRDYVTTLIELDGLLGGRYQEQAQLYLSLIDDSKEHNGWTNP
ncbi:MAG: hypothetical protein ACLFVK_04250 [Dehalococcoidia bacterium]